MTQTLQNNGLHAIETTSNIENIEDIETNQNTDGLLKEWHEFTFGGTYQEQSVMESGTMSQMLDLWNADIVEGSSYIWPNYTWDDNTYPYNVTGFPSNNSDAMDSPWVDFMDPVSVSMAQGSSPTFSISLLRTPASSNTTPPAIDDPVSNLSPRSEPSPSLSPKAVYTCDFCASKFMQKGLLRRHIKQHTRPVKCPHPTCTHRTAEKRDLNRHLMKYHPELVSCSYFFCPVAGCAFTERAFKRKDHLTRHLKKHARLTH